MTALAAQAGLTLGPIAPAGRHSLLDFRAS
jgi:hypothetical protein